ncbi:MAG: ATP-binding protein, partial [bacterium]|nr:ATP-binding protein [bacterium]
MDPALNPYAPGAGQRPPELAGRAAEIASFEVTIERLAAGRTDRGVVLTGLRGVGKTVLLEEFRGSAERLGWLSAFVEADPGKPFRLPVAKALTASLRAASLRHRSSARLRNALRVFRSFSLTASPDGSVGVGIDLEPLGGRADSGDLELDLSELLVDLGEAAAEFGAGVLLLVDEMQEVPRVDLAALAGATHQANRLGLPVAVCGAGLPNLPALLTEAKTYSERLFAYRRIGALAEDEAVEALQRPAAALGVTWQLGALNHAVHSAGGYPYFLQVFGKIIWDTAPPGEAISAADAQHGIAVARVDLRESFYGPRWERATPVQHAYLRAMAAIADVDGVAPSRVIADRLGRSQKALSTTRERLIRQGLIYPSGRGQLAFALLGHAGER